MRGFLFLAVIPILAAALAVRAQGPAVRAERLVQDGFKSALPAWRARLDQDETQAVCSATRNAPSARQARAILAREKATIRYPADGKLLGNWKQGEALAQSGYGGRFTDDPPRAPNGGNCYACHQLDRRELSYGTLGPSLSEYGRIRKYAQADAKAVYERIYNPHATLPCANMPRLGANKILTIEQITDLVAYVMSPESPVNK